MNALTPSQKGAIAEAAISAAVIELGLTVLRPLCEGQRYDVVVDLEPELLRVQCKLARRVEGVLAVPLRTNRYTPQGYLSTSYGPKEVDAIAAYSPETRGCFLIPICEVTDRSAIHLRIAPTGNNQAQGIKWARDYDLPTMIRHLRDNSGGKRAPVG